MRVDPNLTNALMTISLTKGDATEWLMTLETESIDLIVTDPAYCSLDKHRARGTTPRLTDWFPTVPNDYFGAFLNQCYRVLKRDTHLYVICDAETMFAIKPMGEAAGFTFWKPITWDKASIGMGYHYRSQSEFILFFEKGKRKLNNLGTSDVLRFPKIKGGYPTEKPTGLLQVLIEQSTQPGELVIDPFMGGGSTGAAALNLGRHFAGCDISEAGFKYSHDRLSSRGALVA
jgi:site-specific DNA-methyltransferase (adenine-specific)